jgi:uncharacterized protein (DUF433 family)
MPRVKRITMFRAADPALSAYREALERLRQRDLVGVRRNGTLAVYPGALDEELDEDERQALYRLLGFEVPDPDTVMVVRRPGYVGGRAMVAGTRIPVWRVWRLLGQGVSRRELRMMNGLSDAQIDQALAYAAKHPEEMNRDVFDAERAEDILHGVTR